MINLKKITIIIRLLLTITILGFVWLNAHWSVALALTLMTIKTEGDELYFTSILK